jgi:DNA-binding NtrC family response regulator
LPTYLSSGDNGETESFLTEIPRGPLKKAKKDFERNIVETELIKSGWNKSRVAKRLGISRPLLYTLLKRYGIEQDD